MSDDKLTRKSQEALNDAVQRATAAGNPNLDGLHLLAALLEQDGGTAAPLLCAAGADPDAIANRIRQQLARLPRAAGATVSAPATSRQLLAAMATAAKRAEGDVRRVRRPSTCSSGWPRTAGRRRPRSARPERPRTSCSHLSIRCAGTRA